MIWVKNLNFHASLFLFTKHLVILFNNVLKRKPAFLTYKKVIFKKSKNLHFCKGVNPWFWLKISLWTGSLSGEKIARKGKGRGERACRHTFEAAIPPSCNYLAEHLSARSVSVNQFRAWVTPGKIIIKRENIRVLLRLKTKWNGPRASLSILKKIVDLR